MNHEFRDTRQRDLYCGVTQYPILPDERDEYMQAALMQYPNSFHVIRPRPQRRVIHFGRAAVDPLPWWLRVTANALAWLVDALEGRR